MENVALHGVKSNPCPKCEVHLEELGNDARYEYPVRDYARHKLREREDGHQSPVSESDAANGTSNTHGINMGPGIFDRLHRVSAPDLHMLDLLHTIYLKLFKHMRDWIHGFLKKHARLQAFYDTLKTLPPYPGFFIPKNAYREIPQWQGKEMRNLGHCLLGVLAVTLRQPDSTQAIPFKCALACVRALIDCNMMPQYRSHTSDTITYMEDYLDQFHLMKDIFLEFRVCKCTQTKIDEERKEIRRQRAQMEHSVAHSKRRRVRDKDREEENDRCMDLIQTESHFNFIKMHLLSHFCDHIRQFGNILMYSTEYGELAHKDQIKNRWWKSNKNDPE